MSSEYVSTQKDESLCPAFLEDVSRPDRFSYWLRSHRERLGLSCEDMSLCCGLEVDTWGALEDCQLLDPSWAVLNRLATALETSPGTLMIVALLSEGARRLGLR
jgi:hypothetical protein